MLNNDIWPVGTRLANKIINRYYVFGAVLDLWKNWDESTESPYTPSSLHTSTVSIIINILHYRGILAIIQVEDWYIINWEL